MYLPDCSWTFSFYFNFSFFMCLCFWHNFRTIWWSFNCIFIIPLYKIVFIFNKLTCYQHSFCKFVELLLIITMFQLFGFVSYSWSNAFLRSVSVELYGTLMLEIDVKQPPLTFTTMHAWILSDAIGSKTFFLVSNYRIYPTAGWKTWREPFTPFFVHLLKPGNFLPLYRKDKRWAQL